MMNALGKVNMNRVEFMKQLESLLQNISPAEREEALQYYNDYFNDAGPENEQEVIEALGNPFRVAENIKKDLYGSGYGESAFQREEATNRAVTPYQAPGSEDDGQSTGQDYSYNSYSDWTNAGGANTTEVSTKSKGKLSTGVIVLIIVLCVLAAPIILSVASGILSVVVGLVAVWFSLIIAFGAAALALLVVLVVLFVVGIMCLFVDPLAGLAVMGIGMLCGGFGLLLLMLTVAMAGIATPAIFKGIISLVHKITNKGQVA